MLLFHSTPSLYFPLTQTAASWTYTGQTLKGDMNEKKGLSCDVYSFQKTLGQGYQKHHFKNQFNTLM